MIPEEMSRLQNQIVLEFDSKIVSAEAIKRAAYDYGSMASFDIANKSGGLIRAKIDLMKTTSLEPNEFIQQFRVRVLDHQIRIENFREFKVLREIIVAQAFAPCENLVEIVKKLEHEIY